MSDMEVQCALRLADVVDAAVLNRQDIRILRASGVSGAGIEGVIAWCRSVT